MGLVEAILEGSSLVREAKEKAVLEARAEGHAEGRVEGWECGRVEGWESGRAEGWEKGREEGQVGEARRLLRSALQRKFPGLEAMPEIDAITPVETLEWLLIGEVLSSNERTRVEQALLAAAPVRRTDAQNLISIRPSR
jgi:hypothetical protein